MHRLFKIFTTPTARSSAIYYVGSIVLSIGRYFFHLVLLRLLLPSEYGEFLAYLSLLYLLGVPNNTVNNIVVKFVSEFRGKGDGASINHLFYYLVKKLAPASVVLSALLILLRQPLAVIFKAHPIAFVILGFSVLLSLISSILRSYLTAFHRFTAQIVIGALEVVLTILFAVILIKMHYSATGAVAAQLLAGVISLFIVFFLIRPSIYPPLAGQRKFNLGSFTGFSLIFALGSLSLISTDILVVRYLFSEHLSGIYSSLSVLGRSIYFILGPLIALVLPIATHRHTLTNSARSVFIKLGGVIVLLGSGITGIFIIFPKLIINFISGGNYQEAALYLPLFSVSMLLFSLSIFIISYLMAIGKPQANFYLLLATVAQPLMIFIFHASLNQVVLSNLLIEGSLFILLLWQVRRQQL